MRRFFANLDPATVVMLAVCIVALSTMLSALAYLRLNAIADDNHCSLVKLSYYTGDGPGARESTENFNRYLRGEFKTFPPPVPFPKELCK